MSSGYARLRRRCGALLAAASVTLGARAQMDHLPAAAPDLTETGTPAFVIRGAEELGLSSPPTDIHGLPDGRILVVAAHELAIGDGVRWETFRREAEAERTELETVIVDRDGAIYASVAGAFARIEFGHSDQWHFTRVASFPAELADSERPLTHVSEAEGSWYWTAGSGPLVTWRPGRPAALVGYLNDLERVLPACGAVFASDRATGTIHRIEGGRLPRFAPSAERNLGRAVISSAPLPDGRALVGTYIEGVRIFDGTTTRPLVTHGLLAGRYRVADVCALGDGYYCAALDGIGLVFFDEHGHIVQALDRAVDHRLGRVRHLHHLPGSGLWALLNEGVAQVEFPARVSYFESRVTTGLTYAQLCRHEGRLWLLADGQAQRGVYDDDGRLLRFDVDTPDRYVNAIASVGGRLILATEAAVYQRLGASWQQLIDGVPNALLCPVTGQPDQVLLVARGEVDRLRFAGARVNLERYPAPSLNNSYSIVLHAGNSYWAEQGVGRVARITPSPDGSFHVRVFDRSDGLPDGWVQQFLVDGVMRFNVAGQAFRYDAASDAIRPDRDFLQGAPVLMGQEARPIRDAHGRLWVTSDSTVHVLDDSLGGGGRTVEHLPPGLRPNALITEQNGVVWLHQRGHLARFDPAMPERPSLHLEAVISHVHLVGTNRHWVFPPAALPALDYTDNALVVHFLAPATALGSPVTFEVRLEGSGSTWTAAGPSGLAVFDRLKEGRYSLHVRPRAENNLGSEANLAFSIRPPWFRTPLAYVAYLASGVGLIILLAWSWSLLARRERARLARLVAERTQELNRSEKQYRRLSEELEQRVAQRTAELHLTNDRLVDSNRELEAFSYSISHDLRAPLRNISGFTDLLRRRATAQLDTESNRFLGIISTEATRLGQLIDSLLAFSRLSRTELKRERFEPAQLVAAVRSELALDLAGRQIEWQIEPLPRLAGDPALLRQVFANLIGNAVKFTRDRKPARIAIGVLAKPDETGRTVFYVRDNGVGFEEKYAGKLFGVFQRLHSPKDFEGTGIGLANVRRIVARHGGRVWAESVAGEGATFYFALPADREGPAVSA